MNPQPMQALARANHVRAARAATKGAIRTGRINVAKVIFACPAEIEGMAVADLLGAQYLWGPRRVSELLRRLGIGERRPLGRLTQRQRLLVVRELSECNARRDRRHQPERARLTRPAMKGVLPGAADPAGANGASVVVGLATAHRTDVAERVDPGFVLQLVRYRAECNDCGWVGEWRPTAEQAEADGDEHGDLRRDTTTAKGEPPSATTR